MEGYKGKSCTETQRQTDKGKEDETYS